jgi:SAM-dependent MidA family methyltransferase
VDFSAVMRRARELGFHIDAFMSQGSFLLELMATINSGIDWEKHLDSRLELKELIHPEGMGEKFQVLRLSKGFGAALFPPLL